MIRVVFGKKPIRLGSKVLVAQPSMSKQEALCFLNGSKELLDLLWINGLVPNGPEEQWELSHGFFVAHDIHWDSAILCGRQVEQRGSLHRLWFELERVGDPSEDILRLRGLHPAAFDSACVPGVQEQYVMPLGVPSFSYAIYRADAVRSLLDGHIVLSRELAWRNHYPCIDVLASISRLMPDLVSQDYLQKAGKIREWLSTYRKAEDMINIGAYVKGSNPKIDLALAKNDQSIPFWCRGCDERVNLDNAMSSLEGITKE